MAWPSRIRIVGSRTRNHRAPETGLPHRRCTRELISIPSHAESASGSASANCSTLRHTTRFRRLVTDISSESACPGRNNPRYTCVKAYTTRTGYSLIRRCAARGRTLRSNHFASHPMAAYCSMRSNKAESAQVLSNFWMLRSARLCPSYFRGGICAVSHLHPMRRHSTTFTKLWALSHRRVAQLTSTLWERVSPKTRRAFVRGGATISDSILSAVKHRWDLSLFGLARASLPTSIYGSFAARMNQRP